jgi:hypothetical protein
MTRKSKAALGNDAKVPGLEDIKKLWKSVPPGEWLSLLQEIAPDNKWILHGQNQIKGLCPYHDDSDPSFVLTFSRGMGKCFGSCEKVVVDLVSLVSKLRVCSYTEALMFLNSRFGLSMILGEKTTNALSEYNQIQEMKKATAVAMRRLMSEVIRDAPPHLKYCFPAVQYFTKARGLPIDTLVHLPIGVFGKPEHIKKHIEDDMLHPLYDKYFETYQSPTYWGCPVFHYNDSPGSISRFKLRKPDPEKMNALPKGTDIMSLSKEVLRELYSKVFIYIKDPYKASMGVFGLHYYRRFVGNNDPNIYVTEGEFDVLSVMAGQLTTGRLDFMLIGTGGKGSTNIGFLSDYGIKTAWVVPDHPMKHGDDYAKGILGDKNNYPMTVGSKAVSVKIFTWPHEFQGLDLDDAVQMNGYENVSNFLYHQRLCYFINAVPWVSLKCDHQIEVIKKEFDIKLAGLDPMSETYSVESSNIQDDRKNKLKEVILSWYNYIKDPTDQQAYIHKYTQAEGLDLEKLEEVNTSMYALDTYEGVAKRMYEETMKFFCPAYRKTKPSGDVVCVWSKVDREIVEIQGTEKNTCDLVAMYAGMPITDWFSSILGNNDVYLTGITGKPMEDERVKRRNAKEIMNYVWELYLPGVKHLRDLNFLSQGIHYSTLPASARSQGLMYFVNGKYIFRGKFVDIGQIEWDRLDSAVDNGILFDGLTNSDQWSDISDVTELYEANNVDLLDTYRKIRNLVGQWTFKYDETIREYLSAYIMSVPVMAAIGDVNITFIAGDAESGKTSLIYGLLGGRYSNSEALPHIMEASMASTDSTAAALYQEFDGKSILCVIDEVDQNESRSRNQNDRQADLLKNMYSIPMGGCTIKRGGATRDQRERYSLRMPVLMAGTTVPADSIFLSRIFVIYTVKVPGKQIQSDINMEELATLRRNITIGLLPHVPQIAMLRKRLFPQLLQAGGEFATLSSRFLETVATQLAIYEYIGAGKATDLYVEIVKAYRDRLDSIHGTDTQSSLINTCLYGENIKVMNDAGVSDVVSAKSLILGGDITTLNNSECGVYYLPNDEWIVIVWRQVKYTILKHSRFSATDENALYELASKTPFACRDILPEHHEYIRNALGLADVKGRTSYSVIHAGYLIRSEVLDRKKKDGKGRFEMEPSEATEEPEPAEPEPVEEPVEVAEEPEEKLITEPKEEPPKVEEVEPVEEISQRTASCFGFEV